MKSAIVTGAGAGIGEAISKKLSDNNYRVGMLDLNQDNVIEASKKIDNTTPLCGDVTQEESIVEALSTLGLKSRQSLNGNCSPVTSEVYPGMSL